MINNTIHSHPIFFIFLFMSFFINYPPFPVEKSRVMWESLVVLAPELLVLQDSLVVPELQVGHISSSPV